MSYEQRVKGTLRKVDTSAFASSEEWAEDWIRKNTDEDVDNFKKNGYSCLEVLCEHNFMFINDKLYEIVSKKKFDYLSFSEVEEKEGLLHFHVVYDDGAESLEEAIEGGMKGEDE